MTAARCRGRLADGVGVGVLLATGAVVAAPVLSGGYLTYLDNPAHLAEIHSLAFDGGRGWSDIAFCGFPIDVLHSPLWYGIASGLVRLGLPAGALWAALLLLAYVAPALALYAVARRRLPAALATLPAYLLLVHEPVVVGIHAALGGMWTFYLAAAALILLVDRLARERPSASHAAWIAALAGLVCMTHLFAAVALGWLALSHGLWSLARRTGWRRLSTEQGALLLGFAAASAYWLPAFLARGEHDFDAARELSAFALVHRLLALPDVLTPLQMARHTPAVGLAVLGLSAALLPRRQRDARTVYGLILAAMVALWPAIATWLRLPFPQYLTMRFTYFLWIGLAVAGIAGLARLAPRAPPRRAGPLAAAAAVLAVAAGIAWGQPLRAATAPLGGRDMQDVRALWSWLRANKADDWGRVYLQDTYMTPPPGRRLSRSHVLALTARETGVRQLGPFYSVVPFRARWMLSERSSIYGQASVDTAAAREAVRRAMRQTAATHLVTSNPEMAAALLAAPHFERLHRVGRFDVLHLRGSAVAWAEPLGGGPGVVVERWEPGRATLRVDRDLAASGVLVKTSYHPFWRASAGAQPGWDESGMMVLRDLAPPPLVVELVYAPPVWPTWLSLAGWLGVLALALRGRRHPPPPRPHRPA